MYNCRLINPTCSCLQEVEKHLAIRYEVMQVSQAQ